MFSVLIYGFVLILMAVAFLVTGSFYTGVDTKAMQIKQKSLLLDTPATVYEAIYQEDQFTPADMKDKGIINKVPSDIVLLYKKINSNLLRVCENIPDNINTNYYIFYKKYPHESKINGTECPSEYEIYRDIIIKK